MAVIFFQFPGLDNVACAFTGREGNVSDKVEGGEGNRGKLLARFGPAGLRQFAEATQVHGNRIVRDAPPGTTSLPEADGLMTKEIGLGLMIKTADCQPIMITDKTGSCVMALHSGWKGNRLEFPTTAVREFCGAYGLTPADLLAVRGPSLGNAEFVNFEKEWPAKFAPWFNAGTRTMNLWQLTAFQLQAAGIPANQIYGIDICTKANSDLYFSWRARKDKGRQAGIIWRLK